MRAQAFFIASWVSSVLLRVFSVASRSVSGGLKTARGTFPPDETGEGDLGREGEEGEDGEGICAPCTRNFGGKK